MCIRDRVTTDCGNTFTTVWKNWGANLQTTDGSPSSEAFVPASPNDWKNIKIYLTPFISSQDFQIYIVAKGNKQNNIYIDNINIYGRILPQRLKSQGYLIYPNPFRSSFLVHHFTPPTTLQDIEVYNSTGQRVWSGKLNGKGNTETTINLQGLAAGVYVVKLNYIKKSIVQKIVKLK